MLNIYEPRTVKQQEVRLAEEGPGNRHSHPPAAGEGFCCMSLPFRAEAEAGEDTCRPRFCSVRVHFGQLAVDVTQSDVQSLSLLIEADSIGRCVGEGRAFRLECRKFLTNLDLFLEEMLAPHVRVQHCLQHRRVVSNDLNPSLEPR